MRLTILALLSILAGSSLVSAQAPVPPAKPTTPAAPAAPATKDAAPLDAAALAALAEGPDRNAPDPAPEKLRKVEKKNDAGALILSYTVYTDDKGREVKHGSYIEFFDGGNKKRELTYRHDAPNGFQRWWHSNGQVWMEFNSKLGVRDGNYVEYTRSGQVKQRLIYENGKIITPKK